MFKVITVGDIVLDTHIQIDDATLETHAANEETKMCLAYGSKIPVTGSFQALGGNAANVAAGIATLGLNSAIISCIGADANGRAAIEELAARGVNTELVTADPTASTRYAVVLNFKGERTILSFHESRHYVWPEKLPPTEWLYYTGICEGFESLQDAMLDALPRHPGVRLAANPGSFHIHHALEKLREIIPFCDLFVLNLEEAEIVLGTTLEKTKSMSAFLHLLLARGAKEVVVTDGARGAFAATYEEIWHITPYPVKVVAKTGAGDAFASGYLGARILNHDIKTALSWGAANSAGVISHFGAQKGLYTQTQIAEMLAQFPDVHAKRITD